MRKWLDVGGEARARRTCAIFGGAVPKGATEDQAVAWAVETLKRGGREAGKKGITWAWRTMAASPPMPTARSRS